MLRAVARATSLSINFVSREKSHSNILKRKKTLPTQSACAAVQRPKNAMSVYTRTADLLYILKMNLSSMLATSAGELGERDGTADQKHRSAVYAHSLALATSLLQLLMRYSIFSFPSFSFILLHTQVPRLDQKSLFNMQTMLCSLERSWSENFLRVLGPLTPVSSFSSARLWFC